MGRVCTCESVCGCRGEGVVSVEGVMVRYGCVGVCTCESVCYRGVDVC